MKLDSEIKLPDSFFCICQLPAVETLGMFLNLSKSPFLICKMGTVKIILKFVMWIKLVNPCRVFKTMNTYTEKVNSY